MLDEKWIYDTKGSSTVESELQVRGNPNKAVVDMARVRGGCIWVSTFADTANIPADILKDKVSRVYVEDEDSEYQLRGGQWRLLETKEEWSKPKRIQNAGDGDVIQHGMFGFCVINGFVPDGHTEPIAGLKAVAQTNTTFVLKAPGMEGESFTGYLIIQKLYTI